jgi:hypothetical protein
MRTTMLPRPSNLTYPVRYVPPAGSLVGDRASEPDWTLAHVEDRFAFPWKQTPAPRTEFRALCDPAFFHFAFRVDDGDVVLVDPFRDKQDVVLEDRVELFFSLDDRMTEYFALEIDPLGRTYDYRAAYYRQFDPAWSWPGLETRGRLRGQGYEVAGRLPLSSFESLGFPPLRPGVRIRCGLYRAEFSHDRSGQLPMPQPSKHTQGRSGEGPPPLEDWISWVDPGTPEPDFHVPSSLGWLEIVP